MKAAITTWGQRVSPVFDTACTLRIFDTDDGSSIGHEVRISDAPLGRRAGLLRELGVELLICGAISELLERVCREHGVAVIPWICGAVDEVLDALSAGELPRPDLTMPGCPCLRAQRHHSRSRSPGRPTGIGHQHRGGGGRAPLRHAKRTDDVNPLRKELDDAER